MSAEVPIYRVTTTGSVERLGLWRHDVRELVLEREGYPLLAPGTHRIEGDLPWLFWDMTPSGFMGRRFAARQPQLSLRPLAEVLQWSRDESLRVLSEAGSELAGNVLVGDESRRLFETWQPKAQEELLDEFAEVLASSLSGHNSSSLGGEQPKLVFRKPDADELLVKFSPPLDSTIGQRWSDLLIVEAHCSDTLRDSHVETAPAESQFISAVQRRFLMCLRFDRLPRRGRVGAGTLY